MENQTLQFNTGELYTDHGQRIFAKVVGHHDVVCSECGSSKNKLVVAMIDRDRRMSEYVLVDELTREQVMEEYQYSRYYYPPVGGDLPLFVSSRDYEGEFEG